jgi:hypothetical protein
MDRTRTPSPYQPLVIKSRDPTPERNKDDFMTLRSKIAELERREISQEEQTELRNMKIMHEKIAQEQEIHQLKQQFAYLDRVNAEKEKATLEKHNDFQSTKFELNQHLKTIKNFED